MRDVPDDEPTPTLQERAEDELQPVGALGAAGSLSSAVIGCLLVGWLIGEQTGKNPAAALIGLFTGIVVGLYNLAKQMLKR